MFHRFVAVSKFIIAKTAIYGIVVNNRGISFAFVPATGAG